MRPGLCLVRVFSGVIYSYVFSKLFVSNVPTSLTLILSIAYTIIGFSKLITIHIIILYDIGTRVRCVSLLNLDVIEKQSIIKLLVLLMCMYRVFHDFRA